MSDSRPPHPSPSRPTSRSIGEILDDLRGDFPDISVSKIRFLESQGLISPERSASGYRQFSDADLELLRWILRQQRDHYLPLKVIRRRLKEGDGPDREIEPAASGGAPALGAPAPGVRTAAASVAVDEARLKLPDPPSQPAGAGGDPPPADDDVWLVSDGPDPAAVPTAVPMSPAASPALELWPSEPKSAFSRNDLLRQAGLDERAVSELESFGLLPAAGPEGYGPEAMRIARTCAGLFAYGVEARHLRMYKRFAEQEAAFLSQVVPTVGAKEPGTANRAVADLTELARLGAALRLSMLRVGIGPPPPGSGASTDGGGGTRPRQA